LARSSTELPAEGVNPVADVARRKTLSFRERKMFDHARQLLVYEVAAVKGKPAEKVERDIEKALQVQPEPVDEG
jgi:RNA polymerase-interacting CarD/CdnL/TRCF family regulator